MKACITKIYDLATSSVALVLLKQMANDLMNRSMPCTKLWSQKSVLKPLASTLRHESNTVHPKGAGIHK